MRLKKYTNRFEESSKRLKSVISEKNAFILLGAGEDMEYLWEVLNTEVSIQVKEKSKSKYVLSFNVEDDEIIFIAEIKDDMWLIKYVVNNRTLHVNTGRPQHALFSGILQCFDRFFGEYIVKEFSISTLGDRLVKLYDSSKFQRLILERFGYKVIRRVVPSSDLGKWIYSRVS